MHADYLTQQRRREIGTTSAFVIGFMMFSNVVDMGGAWMIKYLSILLAGAYVGLSASQIRVDLGTFLVVIFVFGVIPTWGLLKGMLEGGNLSVATSQVTPFYVGVIYYLLLSKGGSKWALGVFLKSILAIAVTAIVLILGMFLIPDFPPLSAAFDYLRTLDDIQGKFGKRLIGPLTWHSIYFKATLFYVPAYVFCLYKRKFVYCVIFFVALTLSVSKAGILLCGLFTAWFVLTNGSLRVQMRVFGMTTILITVAIYIVNVDVTMAYVDYLIATVTGKAETTKIRLGHIRSFFDLMGGHPAYLLWGQGVGTQFYSEGMGRLTYNIELDHLDVIRQFGLPWFIAFTASVAVVALRLIRMKNQTSKGWGYAMIALFIAAGTNPLLITPLFMMLLAVCYHYARSRA
ncbi:hypothetical protein [Salisaeta longa]|uniref:hypothetical protein n=1 Tax=Salisaeta longa TaxID=503170 RepID=UPI0003B5E0DF|nr:hypothetical protein [Salisaeta longa]